MRKDLKLHRVAGAAIAIFVGAALLLVTSVLPIVCAIAGYVAAVAAGYAKEYLYDKRHPDKHTVDKADIRATGQGGAMGAVVVFLIAAFLTYSSV